MKHSIENRYVGELRTSSTIVFESAFDSFLTFLRGREIFSEIDK